MSGPTWQKSSPELVERFEAALAGIEGMEQRKMFGYPAGFVGGNLATSLFGESWLVRLPEDERGRLGWLSFEPMPGRPMREYVALPDKITADPEQARAWVERAAGYARTLPPKTKKAPKKR